MAPTQSRSLHFADAILALLDEHRATNAESLAALEIARIVLYEARPQYPTALRTVDEPTATA